MKPYYLNLGGVMPVVLYRVAGYHCNANVWMVPGMVEEW